MAKHQVTYMKNGIVLRLHNRKVAIYRENGSMLIHAMYADKDANSPAVQHSCLRGKVRVSTIKFCPQTLHLAMGYYLEWLQRVNKKDSEKGNK